MKLVSIEILIPQPEYRIILRLNSRRYIFWPSCINKRNVKSSQSL